MKLPACLLAFVSSLQAFGAEEAQAFAVVELIGGSASVRDASAQAFSFPVRGLSPEERMSFHTGDSFFKTNWVASPASTQARDGLGPLFNVRSCSACHQRDGRGHANPVSGELLFRLGHLNSAGVAVADPLYGTQLSPNALPGHKPEARAEVTYTYSVFAYEDGQRVELRTPHYRFEEWSKGPPDEAFRFSPRIAPAVFGLGLVEAIPEADLLAHSDPDDRNQDGISGRPNCVPSLHKRAFQLGRFGWKANVPDLETQTALAFAGDMGITSPLVPNENHESEPRLDSPEIDESIFSDVVLYLRALAVPVRREISLPEVREGAALFTTLGCAACHVPAFKTGISPIPNLSNQWIYPFSDFLLHDMGEALADGLPDHEATPSEWRTPPLWGLGLTQMVSGHLSLLHDGRARSLEEAILWHGGEALEARNRFTRQEFPQRQKLLRFLESL